MPGMSAARPGGCGAAPLSSWVPWRWTDEGYVFRVVRLDPASGDVQWTYRRGGGGDSGFASQLAVAIDGSILAAGTIDDGSLDANGNVISQDDVLIARYPS